MHVIVTGGGTGGHIYPALAIARALRERYENISPVFLGTRRGLEATLIPKEGFPINFIGAQGLSSHPLKAAQALCVTGIGVLQSLLILARYKPILMIGTGGYVSAPVIVAGSLMKIPSVVLEQNIIPGKTTRFLSRLARHVCVSFAESGKFLPAEKVRVTGNPIRPEIVARTREEGRAHLQIPSDVTCILVTGASQGARSINDGIIHSLPRWKDRNWAILHVTGEKNVSQVSDSAMALLKDSKLSYRALGFIRNIEDAYAASDLVICRAGATTLAEITARGLASVIIPYPYSAEGHQEKNARWLERHGGGRVILDAEIEEKLADTVDSLLKDRDALHLMADNCRSLGKSHALEEIMQVLSTFVSNGKV